MLLEQIKKQADKNWEDIEEITASTECWAEVIRYDIDLCHLIRKDTGEVVYEASTEAILKILEDTCDTEMSERRRQRKIQRILKEVKNLCVKKYCQN